MIKFFVKSLGCKVSQYDGERLAESLRNAGLVDDEQSPDLFIVNGCSVTGRASQKVRQLLRSTRRRWPAVKIVLAGCEARLIKQREQKLPEADWLLPDADADSISRMISALSLDVPLEPGNATLQTPLSARTRAFLKVQDGCSQFCSYCIVAHLRGEEWSRPIEDAVAEARLLVREGHRELVLTGIHLGHFRPSLIELLQALEPIEGLERIRISSIESVEVDDALTGWVAASKKACAHFHLPLQSGSDEILRLMRRPYGSAEFKEVVDRIRAVMPLAAITTDLIVGFPGETQALFEQTLQFLKEMQFSRIHIFKFSPRDGTPAATMPGQVDNSTKNLRSAAVEHIWHESAKAFYQKFNGREVEVLWETEENGLLKGFSREYVPCLKESGSPEMVNRIECVKGICIKNGCLFTT